MNDPPAWLAIVDERRALLYACHPRRDGPPALELRASLENTRSAPGDRGRPTMLGGSERREAARAASAHAAPHLSSPGHADEEHERSFAREVADWLDRHRRGADAESLLVFAPPRLLAMLRRKLHPPGLLHAGEFTHLSADQLRHHPTVSQALAAPLIDRP